MANSTFGSSNRMVPGSANSLAAQHNHPHFSPDGKWVVFASSYAGTSAEAVSLPRTDESFGELFALRMDGIGLIRLTHNGSSDGTPEWGPVLKIGLSRQRGQGRAGSVNDGKRSLRR